MVNWGNCQSNCSGVQDEWIACLTLNKKVSDSFSNGFLYQIRCSRIDYKKAICTGIPSECSVFFCRLVSFPLSGRNMFIQHVQ